MVRLPGPRQHQSALRTAEMFVEYGIHPLPAKFRDKAPLVRWKDYQSTGTRHMVQRWFDRSGVDFNFWLLCGQISKLVVVDCDSEAGDAWWRSVLGAELMDTTAAVKTRNGTHYYFRIPVSWTKPVASWSIHPDKGDTFDESFDVRADGTGVIAPPSTHETGFVYQWLRPLSALREAPEELLDGTIRGDAPRPAGELAQPGPGGSPTSVRSVLARLLANPPAAGGRNDWMTKVAGHYAKLHRGMRDLYVQQCQIANRLCPEPMNDAEFTKTIDSVWRAEHENNPQRALDETNGYLKGNGHTLFTQVMVGQGDERGYDIAPYANFDLTAEGVAEAEDGTATYIVTWHTPVGDRHSLIPGRMFGDPRKLMPLIASMRCRVTEPATIYPARGWTTGSRLQAYLESQKPPVIYLAEYLGWHQDALGGQGAFITHDGVILPTGPMSAEDSGVRADTALFTGGSAPHQYGFRRDEREARRVLDEVLSFHDEQVTSVFGAWWAACLLKPQLATEASLFPFVGIQAPSESGKTNGFFSMMVELNGNTRGEVVPTYAALRDMVAAHNNGIVWVDDLDDPSRLLELLRAATSSGTIAKKSEDRTKTASATMRAPIVLSGEHLGLGNQKALVDRAILLEVGSPVGRMSRHDPNRIQWEDVLELRRQYPEGLSVLAGWYVQQALAAAPQAMVALQAARTTGGRSGDKLAILRAGACLLDHLCGHDGAWEGTGPHRSRVEEWVVGVRRTQLLVGDNSLTLEVMPWALTEYGFPGKPEQLDNRTTTPVFIKGSESEGQLGSELTLWVNTLLLAEAWRRSHRDVEVRTQSPSALAEQLTVVASGTAKRFRAGGRTSPYMYYRPITGPLAQAVLDRARGL